MHPIVKALRMVALVAGLALGCMASELSSSLLIATAVIGLVALRRSHLVLLRRPALFMPLAAGVVLAVTYAVAARSLAEMASIYVFAPLLLGWPLLALLRGDDEALDPALPATLTMAGTVGALTIAINDHLTNPNERAFYRVGNAIHFADIAVAAGFMSLIGLFSRIGYARGLFLLAPVLASVSVLLSGSRGPLVAVVVLAAVAVLFAMIWGGLPKWVSAIIVALGLCVLALAIYVGLNEQTGALKVFADLIQTVKSGSPGDESSALRLTMYGSAWEAFKAAPIFGYGLTNLIAAAASFAPPGVAFPNVGHLHNDIADFAVSGGLFGIVGYGLFLLAPLVDALTAPPGPNRRAAIFGALMLVVGFLIMGLTNATFGILMLTVFFAVAGVVISHLARPQLRGPAPVLETARPLAQ